MGQIDVGEGVDDELAALMVGLREASARLDRLRDGRRVAADGWDVGLDEASRALHRALIELNALQTS